jgi:predicted transposase YbfD/YdcC
MIKTSGSIDHQSLATKHFSSMIDPRRTTKGNFQHSLTNILFLVISAVISGADDWETVVLFGENQLQWFKKYGGYKNGIPSCDTLKRVFSALDPQGFNDCFMNWTNSICELAQGEIIAIDGKTIKGTKEKNLPHIVTAFASGNGLSLGQVKTNDKSNEITAIPNLLELLTLKGNTVTIDAMGCQREIAEKIIGKGANYILAVKGNQKNLEQEILDTIKLEKPESTVTDYNLDHGRIEIRTCSTYLDLSHIEGKEKWIGLKTIARIKTQTTNKKTGKISNEQRIYISSLGADANTLNKAIRNHWSVENNLHWTLDVLFREDASRKRKDNAAENFNIVLKVALGMIVKETTLKKSKKNKRMLAAYDYRYREKIMGLS